MEKQTQQRIIFLDILRIFAFLSVLIGHKFYEHLSSIMGDHSTHITLREIIKRIMPFYSGGGTGVVVFFLVSGYIITQVLMKESTSSFMIKRIFRIYPLYVFAILLETTLNYMVDGIPIPGMSTLIPRLTLTGDFFGTPYALADVEWTLRIEILFYVFMVFLKICAWKQNILWVFPIIYFLATVFLQAFGPFTTAPALATGYITLYMPFLFIGSIFFLLEKKLANSSLGILCILYIAVSYLILIPKINPQFSHSHFMITACFLFTLAWMIRNKLAPSLPVIFLSNLTYAVYLFHNWLWDYIELLLKYLHADNAYILVEITALLFLFCYLAHITVERAGIKMGSYIDKKYKSWRKSASSQSLTNTPNENLI
ncbi:MAG: acyltransferase [Gammaproteobacteria bacterium]|nr:acyltransferase [Gammaproteobacteria bacterium]